MEDDRTDEDRIIEALVVEGKQALYEDIDFLPLRQSLYNVENVVPEYDDEISQSIEWCRPNKIFPDPVYFNPSSNQLAVQVGTLPDHTFLGTLMAICAYSKYDLIENIFASRPEDFLKYGIYTCRFYVDGEWVEVITDTNIPCTKNMVTGRYSPAYGTSDNVNETWVAFVEKAFAKAMGSYEEIPNIKVQKALLHLTGGSVQAVNMKDETLRYDTVSDHEAWIVFKKKLENDSIVLMQPQEKKTVDAENPDEFGNTAAAEAVGNVSARGPGDEFFVPEMIYSVVLCRDVGGHELVLMHNPWKIEGYEWTGEWSDSSNDWDLYPELLTELERDPLVPWTRRRPNGYFFISFRNLVKYFNRTYYCKLFPSEKFNFYCARGECRGRHAGGPLVPLRDKNMVLQDAAHSRSKASAKATAAVVVDGDASWFNNPQFRIHCTAPGTTQVYVSVVPLGSAEEGVIEQTQNVHISVTVSPKSTNLPAPLWDLTSCEVLASDRTEPGILKMKGMESSLWNLELDNKHYYHLVPNTVRREIESDFILRVYSTKPIVLESVNPIPQYVLPGEWRRVGDMDSTGGALKIVGSDGVARDNPKWSQNPQYHIEIADPFGKEEMYLKIVLKRTDHNKNAHKSGHRSTNAHDAHGVHDQKKLDALVGLTICKADVLDQAGPKHKKKPPKQNVMGELLPTKVSTLKKEPTSEVDAMMRAMELTQPKTILRKLSVNPDSFHLTTSFCSKTESCVFFPKIPRAWIPNGLLVVPCLNEKNIKGSFDLEVYASEKIFLNALPETYSRSIAGDWVDNASGGNHLNTTWKKNPKFTLKFHYPVHSEDSAHVRITLARVGANWRSQSKRDTVGCMIGFYIFVNHGTELRPFYESTFVPDAEISTETTFMMPQLQHGETYTIMPTTFGEGKLGSFVISILSEYEFAITKDKSS